MPAIVHVNRRLTNVSMHYPTDFESVGDAFFMNRPVDFLSDQFATANKANLLSIRELTPIGDDDTPHEIQLKWDADNTYNCAVYAVASPGKWITQPNSDPSLDYDVERTIQLTSSLRLRLEYLKVKQRLRNVSYMTQTRTLASGYRFDDYQSATSLPISVMQTISDNIGYANNGRKPNRIAFTTHVLRAICRSEEFKDLVKYTTIQDAKELAKTPNGQVRLIEQLIGVAAGTIIIGDHVYNAAAEGQTPDYRAFLGSDMIFGYVEELGLRKWSLSAGFTWSAYPQTPTSIVSIPQYFRGVMQTEEYRAFTVTDPLIIRPELGYLLKGCVNTTDTDSYGTLLD